MDRDTTGLYVLRTPTLFCVSDTFFTNRSADDKQRLALLTKRFPEAEKEGTRI
jgi:hypothetical protein